MALPGWPVHRSLHGRAGAGAPAIARHRERVRAGPAARRAHLDSAVRAHLEGSGGLDVPAFRVPARAVLVQLSPSAGQVDLAGLAGPRPRRGAVEVRAPGDGGPGPSQLARHEVLVVTLVH